MEEEDKIKKRAYQKKYRDNNKEKIYLQNKEWRERNIEREKLRAAEYRANNRETIAVLNRKHYEACPESRILSNIKMRCRKNGIPFDLVIDDIRPPSHCPVLGIELRRNHKGSKVGPSSNSPAVDRIEPTKGYVRGNVLVVSHLANCIKQNATPDQIRKVADFYAALWQSNEGVRPQT